MTTDILKDLKLKYCDEIITKILKNPNAHPFATPVDPVILGIPDYFEKITNPMDISTIRKKLKNKQYQNEQEYQNDFKLMFKNCYVYNPEDAFVHKMGKELEKVFDNLYAKMPTECPQSRGRKKNEQIKPIEKIVKLQALTQITDEDQKKCEDVINELLGPSYTDICWPFIEPITDEYIPGYSNIIKTPTDFTKIRTKVSEKSFKNFDEFHKELKLLVNNCFKFNADVKKIYDCATELDKLINSVVDKNLASKEESIRKIQSLRNQITLIEKEISIYEGKLSGEEKSDTFLEKEYSLGERLELGNLMSDLNQIQTVKVVQIIEKSNINISHSGRNEISFDIRTLPNKCIAELYNYITHLKANKNIRV